MFVDCVGAECEEAVSGAVSLQTIRREMSES
jgi:hypothetical protein